MDVNKKLIRLFSMGLLLSSLPQPIVFAKTTEATTVTSDGVMTENTGTTVEDTPTSDTIAESDLPSVSDELFDQTNISENQNEMALSEVEDAPTTDNIVTQTTPLIEGRPGDTNYQLDADFANVLRQLYPSLGGPNTITPTDLAGITNLNLQSKNLTDLKGLEYFSNLTVLSINFNPIQNLDVSQNKKLENLYYEALSSHGIILNGTGVLDLSQNNQLKYLRIVRCGLTNINLSNNLILETLDLSNNQLQEINLNYNINLRTLEIGSNTALSGTLDLSKNRELTRISFSGNRQLTGLNLTGLNKLESLNVRVNGLTSIDLSTNVSLKTLIIDDNKLTALDVSALINIERIDAQNNEIPELDVSKNKVLDSLICYNNGMTKLEVSGADSLTVLNCSMNELTLIDVTQNNKLVTLSTYRNPLENNQLLIGRADNLTTLQCYENNLKTLDVTGYPKLESFSCYNNEIKELDLSNNTLLTTLNCSNNLLEDLNLSNNLLLDTLDCSTNQLSSLNITNLVVLRYLTANDNNLTSLINNRHDSLVTMRLSNNDFQSIDLTDFPALLTLELNNNYLNSINVSANILLSTLRIDNNNLAELNVSYCPNLSTLTAQNNHISDITSMYGLTRLRTMNIGGQTFELSAKEVSENQFLIDLLKTTASTGLTVTNGGTSGTSIYPAPTFSYEGDKFTIGGNVSRATIGERQVSFNYDRNSLVEGGTNANGKYFNGRIFFSDYGDLVGEIAPDLKKVRSGESTGWTWNISSISGATSSNIRPTLNLPAGLNLVPGSVKVNNVSVADSVLNGSTSLANLSGTQATKITFETEVTGSVNSWKEAQGNIAWTDDKTSDSYSLDVSGKVQVQDDEQSYTPSAEDLAILSTPEHFDYGRKNKSTIPQIFQLAPAQYLTNTKVPSDGFYMRVKDDRAISSGWKLTASLSDFRNTQGQKLPNGSGTSLTFSDMKIQSVLNRDTEQESIVNNSVGAPSTFDPTKTIFTGEAGQTFVSANNGEGQGTWQVQVPFDQVKLNLPADAGSRSNDYSATVTWSLDDAP